MLTKQHQLIAEDLARIYPKISDKLDGIYGKTLLVTGGAGFMGSWLAELVSYLNREEKASIKLYLVDSARELFAERLGHLIHDTSIEFIRCDMRSLLEIPREVNYVIHAAATPDGRFHASSPIETMTTIAEGTSSILRAANRASNLIMFVNVSSSTVYAVDQHIERITETAPGRTFKPKPTSAYSEAKRYAEVLCAAARSEARIPILTVRPFTFCGAYQKLDSPWFLNNFINDALHQRPIRILGDGKSVRTLLYGADLAYWLLVIMLHGKSGQVFNIGSDQAEYLDRLAMRVAANFSPSPSILTNTSLVRTRENTRLVPDISAVKSAFCLEVYTDTAHAISRTIDWYQANLIETSN
jgi:nucleoside-diphosphate-sugar epimerase